VNEYRDSWCTSTYIYVRSTTSFTYVQNNGTCVSDAQKMEKKRKILFFVPHNIFRGKAAVNTNALHTHTHYNNTRRLTKKNARVKIEKGKYEYNPYDKKIVVACDMKITTAGC